MMRQRLRRSTAKTDLDEVLLDGYYSVWPTGAAAPTLDQLRAKWADRRDELLPQFIRQHPGTRPWSWWRFDAPPDAPSWELLVEPLTTANCLTIGLPPADQTDYLREHGLLSADELANLPPPALTTAPGEPPPDP